MKASAWAACAALVATASVARAEDAAPSTSPSSVRTTVSGEVGGGQARPSPDVARSAFWYQKAAARIAPSEAFEVGAVLRVFEDQASATSSSDVVVYGAIDGTYTVAPGWDVTVGVNGSPRAERDVSTTVSLPNTQADAVVRARTMSVGGVVELGYDSFDPDRRHDVDVSIDGGLALTRFETEQSVLSSSRPAVARLGPQSASLGQARIGAAVTFTVAEHTDLGVDAGYFVYDSANPGDVGLFDVTAGGLTTSFGAGLPMLPPRWTVRPEIAERIGPVTARAYYQYTSMAVEGGQGHTVGGRLQVALGSVRPYVSASYRSDVFASGTGDTWMVGAGASLRF